MVSVTEPRLRTETLTFSTVPEGTSDVPMGLTPSAVVGARLPTATSWIGCSTRLTPTASLLLAVVTSWGTGSTERVRT